MKARYLLALLASASIAGTSSTIKSGTSVFHPDGGTTITYKDIAGGKSAHDQCFDAAKAFVGTSSCSDVVGFVTVGDCTDVPKPKWDIVKDADGFLIKPAFRSKFKDGSDTEFVHEVEDYVSGPGYPACWIKGWRVAADWEINGPDQDAPELADSNEPVQLTPALQAAWDASCAERHLAHVFYDGDKCA